MNVSVTRIIRATAVTVMARPAVSAIEAERRIVRVLLRADRFLYAEQIAREMLRDGLDPGELQPSIFDDLVRRARLARIRYNAHPDALAFGFPRWLENDHVLADHAPLGWAFDPTAFRIMVGE